MYEFASCKNIITISTGYGTQIPVAARELQRTAACILQRQITMSLINSKETQIAMQSTEKRRNKLQQKLSMSGKQNGEG